MQLKSLSPRNSLNKAFLKLKPDRTQIDEFKVNLKELFLQINESESEEFHKNLLTHFLKKTYYDPEYLLKLPFINDSNTLDKGFYNELLHTIGLVEIKEKNKTVKT